MNNNLCPINDKSYNEISQLWYKLSPDATELYLKHLIPLELSKKENKKFIEEFIISFSRAYCLKEDKKPYRQLIDKGLNALYVLIARTPMENDEKKKIRQLLINIEYDIYHDMIRVDNIQDNRIPKINMNKEVVNNDEKLIEIKPKELILMLFILIFMLIILYLINLKTE